MGKEIIKNDWYDELVKDCQSIITETVFNSRWALVEGYHQLGERILEDELKIKKGGSSLRDTLQGLAKLLNTSERTLYYSVEFVRKYPKLDKVPEGKNISWNKIITKYLPEGSIKEKELEELELKNHCPRCDYEW